MNIPSVLERLAYRYPSVLVDRVTEHEPGRRIVAVKNVTVNEEFFQGHFPGTPLMPGVLMIESLTQVATLLLAGSETRGERAWLRGVDNAKFRRQVVPGDRLELEVSMGRRRGQIARAAATASVAGHIVAEAELVIAIEPRAPYRVAAVAGQTARPTGVTIHETAVVHPKAVIGEHTIVGPYVIIGPDVKIGSRCTIGASAVIDGDYSRAEAERIINGIGVR